MDTITREHYEELTIFRKEQSATATRLVPAQDMILICGVTGSGKGLAMERIAKEYYDEGVTVINVTDVKNCFENCFQMLPKDILPEFYFHHVENIQKEEFSQIPTIIYHPFTFNLPPRKQLPDINFFTISLKSLTRNHFSFLSETHSSSETVKLMLNVTDKLKNNEGLFSFVRLCSEQIEEKTAMYRGRRIKKVNPEFNIQSSTSGTMKDIQQIQGLFIPFKSDYFLAQENCPHNIDFRKMVLDNEHYHCLTYRWITDIKMKYFAILSFLLGIDEALDNVHHPVCIIIDEIRKLTPDKPEFSFQEFIAEIIKNMLSTLRNKGVTIICGTQSFINTNLDVRESFNEKLFGKIGQKDIEILSKTHFWNSTMRERMTSMKMNHFHRLGDQENDEYVMLFPTHPHKEPDMDFIQLYSKYFPFNLKTYSDLLHEMSKEFDKEVEESKAIAHKKEQDAKEEIKKMVEEKEQKSSAVKKLEVMQEEKKVEKIQDKEELQKACYDLYMKQKESGQKPSFRAISIQLSISSPSAKKYILDYIERKKQHEQNPAVEVDANV